MDYIEKYNKLVEAIKVLQVANPSDEGIQNWINDFVPELAESEDEKIKKEITELVMQPTWKTEKEFHRRKKLCDWLEKQGEQKSAKWSEKDESYMAHCIRLINNAEGCSISEQGNAITWLYSIKQRIRE